MAEMPAKPLAKPHYPHIALARGLSIVLVAFGHSALADMHTAADALGVVRMPFFFLLAGLFFSPQHDVLHYSKQKSIALLTPYFFVLTAIGVKQWLSGGDFAGYMAGVLYGNGQTIAWTPLWFLPHLFLLYTSAALLLRPDGFIALRRTVQFSLILLWLMLFGTVLAYLQPQFSQAASWLLRSGLPWGIDFLPLSLGYFTLGYLLKQQFTQARFNPLLLLGLAVLFAVLVFAFSAAVDFNLRLYTPPLWLPFIVVSGCFMLLQGSLLLSKLPLLSDAFMLCGRYSLYILIFHVFLQQVLQRLAGQGGVLLQLIILLGSIVLSIAAGWLIRRVVLLRYCFEPGIARVKAIR
ncbi:fucose 4-O-acetylase-like acetyltransferase [Rheinheimera pacifica]|uniref:acyltransferase n=1 Tax=Rheinheimera pacifica TaxID=173990 RepID=UPI00216907A4|nr:acyltransferase [Rheinheimera pacifica]MCS4307961.1 fucose 4-O-acetylase-like acetyltransferase [Rheinheimera pacifica]